MDLQQCDVNYREIRRATLWSYEFHGRIDRCVPPAEGTRPYEKLPILTDLAIVHITLLVGRWYYARISRSVAVPVPKMPSLGK
jgi:hypothetical protein